MPDHFDAALAQARQSLAEAQQRAEVDWMAEHEAEVLQRSLEELELEAATWRALTPEEQQALIDERAARMAEIDEDEDEDEGWYAQQDHDESEED